MKPVLMTEQGRKDLGAVLEKARQARGWSLDKLVIVIQHSTGKTISKAAISILERGTVEPKFNTLAIIAAAGYVVSSEGIPYTLHDLLLILCNTTSLNDNAEEHYPPSSIRPVIGASYA